MIVAAIEAVAGAGLVANYLRGVPTWMLCLVLLVIMTVVNLLSVKAYGEAEFWFASIKIVAIIFVICAALVYLSGVFGNDSPGVSNLTAEGGLFPLGILAAIVGSVTCLFSMGGAEIATIAAAESERPAEYAAKATKQVMYRVFVFYVLSVFAVVCVVPWNIKFADVAIKSPFAVALDRIGIPIAGGLMQVVVLTAVLSSLNSCLYITSRMLFVLSEHGEAPKFFTKVSKRGVPARAIVAGTVFGYVAVVANYFFPKEVFLFLINSSGAIQLIYYIILVAAEVKLRKRCEREGERVKFGMWFFPVGSYVTIAWMFAVLVMMGVIEDTRSQLWLSLVSFAAILGAYAVVRKRSPQSSTG